MDDYGRIYSTLLLFLHNTLAGTTSHLAHLAEQRADKTWSKTGKHKHDNMTNKELCFDFQEVFV